MAQGEIHGLISREDAQQKFWQPYGERIAPMPELFLAQLDPEIIAHTAAGARPIHLKGIVDLAEISGKGKSHIDRIQPTLEINGISNLLGEFVLEVIDDQIREETAWREREFEEHDKFLNLFQLALRKLGKDGWFGRQDIDRYMHRLVTEEGLPVWEPVPITPVHFLLSERSRQLPAPPLNYGGATDMGLGVIYEVLQFKDREFHKETGRSRKVHEHFHALDGLELWEVTYDSGLTAVDSVWSGLYGQECSPTTFDVDYYDYSVDQHFEANEGMKELLTVAALRSVHRLGRHYADDSYADMAQHASTIWSDHPRVWQAMAESSLVDADPVNPGIKNEAIRRLNEIAELEFGVPNSLDTFFRS